jgi:hypothetical protein
MGQPTGNVVGGRPARLTRDAVACPGTLTARLDKTLPVRPHSR